MGIDDAMDQRALDSLAVAPPADEEKGRDARQDAGQDQSIHRRLQDDPADTDARLDAALDEPMDASDPPASTQPVHSNDPAPSSGYDEDAEKARTQQD